MRLEGQQGIAIQVKAHLLEYLGTPSKTWTNDRYDFKAWRFDQVPTFASLTYVTWHERADTGATEWFTIEAGTCPVLQLVLSCYSVFASEHIEDLLFVVGGDILKRARSLRKGEVSGAARPLVAGASAEALFCVSPPFLPETFDQISPPTPLVFVGRLPITSNEANYVKTHGWKSFEETILREQPDVLDLKRETLPVCETS